ncbi:helix-turn-helix transcriptional regulator [Utexia brackfieldae]|uniref:helix-turn-helix domain-containing protein n=1 Tax=Utexia brackfieldae TaxID=3074108 RepID=UPI00370DA466
MLLGDRIKQKRLALNLSQETLAKATGMTQQSICDIESGRIQKPRSLVELARALDCSAEWLYDGK